MVVALAVMLLVNVIPEGASSRLAHAQSADSSIDFAENRTAAVAAFVAHDQDGDAIRWSLSGPDAGRFTIDGGVLAFRESPNYEDPRSAARSNVYRVTIEASGGTHDVAVTVLDVDEAGTVNIDRPQPQVSRPLGASLSDEDQGVAVQGWQWARSADSTTWTDIEGATSPRRSPAPDDVGMYLRATVAYSDKFGSDKTAEAVSAYRVEAKTLSNAAPSFAEQDDDEATPYVEVARSVEENTAAGTAIGSAVSALDADGDILFYELLDTPDLEDAGGNARFTIDSLSGQIRVGKVLGADDDEREDEARSLSGSPALPEGEEASQANNSEYVLRVRASDPSTASATVNVIVTVTNVNEPPAFDERAPTLLRVTEGTVAPLSYGDATSPATVSADTFAVTDQDGSIDDGPNSYDDTSYTYSVTGADSDVLTFDGTGVLSFTEGHEPDYEEQSSYSITVVASSGEGTRRLSATLDVTIEVVNGEDAGAVTLSQREPQVGREVHATVSDPDGGVTVRSWMWARSDEDDGTPSAECRNVRDVEGWTTIDGATSSVYTPALADVGTCLRATATYTDNIENAADADDEQKSGVTEKPVQASNPANTAPRFVVQSSSTSRSVFENTEARHDIGTPVSAHDDDGDLLIYALGGADAASFGISRNNGQLKTKAPLDYEARRSYTVEVTATDPSGAAASILVVIRVSNKDEPAQITGTSAIDFAENGTARVASFTARDPERRSIRWSLGGRDADRFTISRGALGFKRVPDHEDPHSALEGASLAERNVYRVTLEASGGTHDVAVRVTDVDEPGTVSMDRPQPQVDRPLSVSLQDEDEGVAVERWQWASSEDGITWTDIEGAMSPRRSPAPADAGMYLRATVTYSDRFGAGKSASAVSANRVEPKTASNTAPSFADLDDDESTPYIARSVPENTAAGMPIGEPVSRRRTQDEDVLWSTSCWTPPTWRMTTVIARFTIDSALRPDKGRRGDGSRRQGAPKTRTQWLDSGGDADDDSNSEYVLRVMVSDPSTASATVNVIVTVADVNEPPAFSEDVPTMLRVREVTEVSEDPDNRDTPTPGVLTFGGGDTQVDDETYNATDQDGDGITYSLSGPDSSAFTFNSEGILSFRPDREPDFEKQSSYSIRIKASSGGQSTTLDVTIEVVNTHDRGEVHLSQKQPHVGIEIEATVSDPDGGVEIIRWAWERTENDRLDPIRQVRGNRSQ